MKKKSFRILTAEFGEVIIEPRGRSGIYSVSFRHQGRHVRRSLKTSNKETAIRNLQQITLELKNTHPDQDCLISFEDGLELYLESLRDERKPVKTVQQMLLRITSFFAHLRSMDIHNFVEIKPIHADSFRRAIKQDRSMSTVFGYYRCVKAMLAYLESREIIDRDPFARIKFKRPEFKHSKIPALEQVNQILKQVVSRYLVFIAALAFMGCRREELTTILTRDVDLEIGTILIRKPENQTSKTIERIVPIHPRLHELLKQFKRPRSRWYFCTLPSPRNLNGGRKMKADYLNQEFQRAARAAGFPAGRKDNGFTLHSLRGFFRSHTVFCGVPTPVIDFWQGHRGDRSVAMKHYFDLQLEQSIRFMNQVNFDCQKGEK